MTTVAAFTLTFAAKLGWTLVGLDAGNRRVGRTINTRLGRDEAAAALDWATTLIPRKYRVSATWEAFDVPGHGVIYDGKPA